MKDLEDKRKHIDTRLEQKIGFDRVRRIIADRCSTEYAAGRTASETFCTNAGQIRKRTKKKKKSRGRQKKKSRRKTAERRKREKS